MTRSRTRLVVSGVAVSAALLATGCSSGSSESTATTASKPAATTAPKADSESASKSESSTMAEMSETMSATMETAAANGLPKTLVFSPFGMNIPAMQGLAGGLQKVAGEQGWEVIIQDPKLDPGAQVQQLNEVVSSGKAGAVWVLALAPDAMGDFLKQAQDAGIPVLINGQPEEYGYDGPQPGITFDYIDQAKAGGALGDEAAACIDEKLGGKGEIIWAQSAPGSVGKEEFEGAVQKSLTDKAAGSKVVQTLIAGTREESQTAFASAIQAQPNANVVIATNDEAALGALGAFEAAGQDLPCLVEFGGNDEVLGLVKDGTIYASIALQFGDDMFQSFQTLAKMQADPSANGEVLTVPQKTIKAGQ